MKLTKTLSEVYTKEQKSALSAQRLAQEIAFAPMVFQVSRLMVKFGILEFLSNNHKGVTQNEIVEFTGLSNYAVQVLLEASLSIGTVLTKDDKYTISKAGWFLFHFFQDSLLPYPQKTFRNIADLLPCPDGYSKA